MMSHDHGLARKLPLGIRTARSRCIGQDACRRPDDCYFPPAVIPTNGLTVVKLSGTVLVEDDSDDAAHDL
jgi:hypothetical protein